MNTKYQKGEIVFGDLGNPPNEVKGHEQAKERPCLVLKQFDSLGLIVVVPCTSKAPKYNNFTIVKLLKGSGSLTVDSYVLCHQIRTISVDRVLKKMGKIDSKDLLKVQTVLIDILEL